MYSDSNEADPENEYAPLGPLGCTPGARSTTELMSRLVGSSEMKSCLKFVATCAVWVSTSAFLPTTSTVSVTPAMPMVTFRGSVWVGARLTVRSWRSKPLNWNDTLYV